MSKMTVRVLNDSEMHKLHEKTLEIFETVGIKITHDETLTLMKKAGASINESTGICKIPGPLVEEMLQLAPSVIYETGLNGKKMEVGGQNSYCLSLVLDPFIVDYEQGLRRPVLEDVRRHTIIGESLDRIDSLMRMQYPVSDIPGPDTYLKTIEMFLCHHTKHTSIYPTSEANCRIWMDAVEVIAEAAGLDVLSTPLMSIAMAVTSPLQVHAVNIEIMKMAMERCYPIIPTVCPMAGTTSPYSIAGTALIANVEALIPVVISQIYRPGHPVLYGTGPSVTDMKTGHDLYYRAEKMKFKTIAIQMGKYYDLPVCGEAGGTLSHRGDVQNGAESMLFLLSSFAGGQNIIGGFGSMYNASGMSAEQIIMQCGLADIAEYVISGIDMSDYKLAIDSIRNVGPGGNFLADQLTIEQLRGNEFFQSPFLDLTGGYEQNTCGMYEIAHRKAQQLVDTYKTAVPEKVEIAVREFFQKKYTCCKTVDAGC